MLTVRSELGRRQVQACLLLAFCVLAQVFRVDTCVQQSNEVYVYVFPETLSYERILEYVNSRSDWEVIFYNLNDSSSAERFLNIIATLQVQGVDVLPTGLCIPCELQQYTWDEIWTTYAAPLTGFFSNGRLSAVTVGISYHETLDRAAEAKADRVEVFAHHSAYILTDEDVRSQLETYLVGPEGREKNRMDALRLISSILFLALADSVNPCTFAVFTALLLIALHSFGRVRTVATGFSFILAVFMGYYTLGLGLVQIFAVVPNVKTVLAVIGLVIGAFSIVSGLGPGFKSPIPKSVRRLTERRLGKSSASSVASFGLGLVATFTLLPCSVGPYLVGLGLLSGLGDPVQGHLLLAVYNIMFVAPLIAILMGLLAFSSLSRKVKVFRSTKLGLMEIISGSLLVAACLWILLS